MVPFFFFLGNLPYFNFHVDFLNVFFVVANAGVAVSEYLGILCPLSGPLVLWLFGSAVGKFTAGSDG